MENLKQSLKEFFEEDGEDPFGRTLIEILEWNDEDWTKNQDFLQNLFPTPDFDPINPSALRPTRETLAELGQIHGVSRGMLQAWARFLLHLGMRQSEDGSMLCTKSKESMEWLQSATAVDQRISLALKSMFLSGHRMQTEAFLTWLRREVPIHRGAHRSVKAIASWSSQIET